MADTEIKKEKKVGTVSQFGMMALAIGTDGLQALLAVISIGIIGIAVNSVISAFVGMIFFIWFAVLGVNFINLKRLSVFAITLVIEMVPIFNDAPMWTIGIALIIASANAESTSKKTGGFLSQLNPFSKIANEVI